MAKRERQEQEKAEGEAVTVGMDKGEEEEEITVMTEEAQVGNIRRIRSGKAEENGVDLEEEEAGIDLESFSSANICKSMIPTS